MVSINSFEFCHTPRIIFGSGVFKQLPDQILQLGIKPAIITGASFLSNSGLLDMLSGWLSKRNLEFRVCTIKGEPSPEVIDKLTDELRAFKTDVVVAIGGGSAIDAGKAIAAMLTKEGSVKDYLEGVGTRSYDGSRLPLIAVSTTAGTGSEATKNAVLSSCNPLSGFKKSLRHDGLVPDLALVDPILSLSCPARISAACALDAFTQLFEGYVSPKASALTDALALSGLRLAVTNLLQACSSSVSADSLPELMMTSTIKPGDTNDFLKAKSAMCYASLLSGIVLANAGLGVIHGFASVIGGYFPAPHGLICGQLLAPATCANITRAKSDKTYSLVMDKMRQISRLVCTSISYDEEHWPDMLCQELENWTSKLNLESLANFGLRKEHLQAIIERVSIKSNCVALNGEEIASILAARL